MRKKRGGCHVFDRLFWNLRVKKWRRQISIKALATRREAAWAICRVWCYAAPKNVKGLYFTRTPTHYDMFAWLDHVCHCFATWAWVPEGLIGYYCRHFYRGMLMLASSVFWVIVCPYYITLVPYCLVRCYLRTLLPYLSTLVRHYLNALVQHPW